MFFPRATRPASDFRLPHPDTGRALAIMRRRRRSEALGAATTEILGKVAGLLRDADDSTKPNIYRDPQTPIGIVQIRRRAPGRGEGLLLASIVDLSKEGEQRSNTTLYGYRTDGRDVHASVSIERGRPTGIGYYDGERRVSGNPTSNKVREIQDLISLRRIER